MSDIAKHKLTTEQKTAIANNEWLTDRQRTVFELRHKRGWKIADIAAELDISTSTVNRELKMIQE